MLFALRIPFDKQLRTTKTNTMHKLSILSVIFDTRIAAREIQPFRSAIIEKVGREHHWFHNHNNEEGADCQFYNRYPLVQYKRNQGKPMLVFIGKGVEEAQFFFAQKEWDLEFAGKQHSMKIDKMIVKHYDYGVSAEPMQYRLKNWIALNQTNYKAYKPIEGLAEKTQFLEKTLIGHIHAFAGGVGWKIEEWVNVSILDIDRINTVQYKRTKVLSFDIRFKVNLKFPPYIGLGKMSSLGYGQLRPVLVKTVLPISENPTPIRHVKKAI